MSDDLDDLKQMMDAATPPPDPARRKENIALAQKNFENLQEFWGHTRPTSDRPTKGLMSGVRKMLNIMSSRGALTATTALVAVYIAMLSPLGDNLMPTSRTEPPARRRRK